MDPVSNHSPQGNRSPISQVSSLETFPVENKYVGLVEIEYSGFVPTPPPPPPPSPLTTLRNRIWRILTFVIGWGAQVITKAMECFQSIQFRQPKPSILEAQEMHGKEFCQLFHSYICYEKFRDQVLLTTYKKKVEIRGEPKEKKIIEEPSFNHYGSSAYFTLKEQNLSLDQYSGEERELRAGIAVYDAIVGLYVKRFLTRYSKLNQEEYLPSLQTIALIIAIKLFHEKEVLNYHFQFFLFPFIGLKKLQKMEIEFAKGINWDFSITRLQSDYKEIDSKTENEFKTGIATEARTGKKKEEEEDHETKN